MQVNSSLSGMEIKLEWIISLRTIIYSLCVEETRLTSVDLDFYIYKRETLKPLSKFCFKH